MRFALLAAALVFAACSSKPKEADIPAIPPAPPAAAADAATPSAADVSAALTPKAEPAKPAAAHHAVEGVEPAKALGWLKNGNKRFMKGHVRKDGQSRKDIERLSKGQKPHTIVLSCSDSRVPPEVVFDQKLGEIFVVRTAGETLDNMSIGSIEYAIEHLGARLILVMGHTSCGAVNAAIKTINGGSAGTPALNALVADIHPRIRSSLDGKASPDGFRQAFDNAKGVGVDLAKRSELIGKALAEGRVTIASALYNLDSGEVIFE